MNSQNIDSQTLSCTAVGTLLVLITTISPGELLNSVVIAATGTLVSFIISLVCKFAWRKIRKE